MDIGWIRSFKDKDKWFLISRIGKAKIHGGKGVRWVCGCPNGRKIQPCCHLLYIYKNSVDLPKKKNFRLLAGGRTFYKRFYKINIDRLNFLMTYVDGE